MAGIPFPGALAQTSEVTPVAEYNFDTGEVEDAAGTSELFLHRGANLYTDSTRGEVLRFQSSEESYASFSKQLLNKDSCTFSFFFYWEDAGSTSWHQLFEIYNQQSGSNLYLTPSDGWNKKLTLISNNLSYNNWEAISSRQIPKNEWVHLAVTFADKKAVLYVNGEPTRERFLMFPPKLIRGDSLFLAGNPHRSDDYYITARYDEVNIFHEQLAANQVKALSEEKPLPEASRTTTNWQPSGETITVAIDPDDKKQTIRNFGSSDAWYTEAIGKYWPVEKKKKLAELLFSKEKDADGNPEGLGLSSWRFNIGAGTAEQGEASRIASPYRRTEGFLSQDGQRYAWSAQAGQQWFLNKAAKEYDVHHIIGWQNSPPVAYTKNNLGFREVDAPMSTILKDEHFDDFGIFLADVVEYFENRGIDFDYISPLNEPQYGWAPDEAGGDAKQEGTPWTNQEIHDVVGAINNEFVERDLDTKLFIPEAGNIGYLLGGDGHASNQLYHFWNPSSSRSLISKESFADIVSYHSYWNDYGNQLVSERRDLKQRAENLDSQPELWQTEYSLLGSGYRWNQPDGRKLTEMECALSLARVLVTDLNVAQTNAWQWWSTFGLGKHNGESRFDLIHIYHNQNQTDGLYHINKLFYTYGNFTHFIRPGMQRVGVNRSDGINEYEAVSDVMFSAYTNDKEDKLVCLTVNHTDEAASVDLSLNTSMTRKLENLEGYLTNEYQNLTRQDRDLSPENIVVPAHSVLTITADISREDTSQNTAVDPFYKDQDALKAYHAKNRNAVVVSFDDEAGYEMVRLFSLTGALLDQKKLHTGQEKVIFPVSGFARGVYLISAEGKIQKTTRKVVVIP